ncbi:MAG: GNAT family N-acetyltransferase [Oligoflexia bacterium]|nr:GNAT family N-acetyltransferase [Oligoflexia bacterium]
MSSIRFQRIADERDFEPFLRLLNASFPVPRGNSFLEDFPVWGFRGDETVFHLGGVRDGLLVSAAAARVARLKTPGGARVPVGLIGAVATHSCCRGEGLASRAVAKLLEWLSGQKVALVALWGSEHDLYRKLGFELCGIQRTLPLRGLELPVVPDSETRQGWTPALWQLLRERPLGLALEEQDRGWVEAHRNTRWYWRGEASRPTAYAALGKGIDLAGLVHEFGGQPDELRKLLAGIRREHPDAALLGHSSLIPFAGNSDGSHEYLCMARFMDLSNDPERVFRAFLPDARYPAPLTAEGPELVRRLFGGPGMPAPEGAEGRLPLPLWFWGLDGA